MKHAQKARDDKSILLIGLGCLGGELHEVGDEEWIDDHSLIAFFGKKDGEVDIMAGSRLFPDKHVSLGNVGLVPQTIMLPSMWR